MKISGYKIEKQIGKGGMATVYLAIQESLARPVALKVMNPFYSDSAEFSERFLEEGRLLASIQHSNIITIHDIGISAGLHFISMEYVEGDDLAQRIINKFNASTAIDYLETLASCLDVAHDLHIVHRDIKPANILFRKDGTLLLTDFGIAKQLTANNELTVVGSIIGSPHYLSPEQALGKVVDGRADLYSLGILFYEMLTSERPYSGNSAIDIANQHITQNIPALPADLVVYQDLIKFMTRKNPDQRFPSCKSLLTAIQELKTRGRWSGQIKQIPLPELPINLSTNYKPCITFDDNQITTANEVDISVNEPTIVEKLISEPDIPLTPNTSFNKKSAEPETFLEALTFKIKQKTSWIVGTVLVILVIFVILIFSIFNAFNQENQQTKVYKYPTSTVGEFTFQDLSLQNRETIDELIQNAELALQDYRLTTPFEASAYMYYQKILELDPGNLAAQQGIVQIAEIYYNLAKRAESDWDYDKANKHVKQGLIIAPDNKLLIRLQETLQTKNESTKRNIKKIFKGAKKWLR